MKERRYLLFPLLAIVVAAALWFFQSALQGPSDPGNSEISQVAEGGEGELGQRGGEEPEARSRAARVREAVAGHGVEEEPAEYRRALGGIHGRLVWSKSGEPVPGVEVQIVEIWLDSIVPSLDDVLGLSGSPAPFVFRARGRTDGDGYFELPGVHSRAILLLAIGLRTDKAAVRVIDRVPGPGESVDLGDIALKERGSVRGRVVDPAGNPVAGARVRVADVPRLVLQFGVDRFDPEGMLLVMGPVKIVMPMPSWVAKYDKDLPFGDTTTDGEGNFVVEGVRPGQSTLLVRKVGLMPATRMLRVRSQQESTTPTIKLREGARLTGQFVDTQGNAVRGVRVSAGGKLSMGPFGFLQRPSEVDGEGRFDLPGLPRGKLWLVYQREPGEPWEIKGPHRSGDVVNVVLGARRAGSITVQDAQGAPIQLVRLSLFGGDETSLVPLVARRIPTAGRLVKDDTRKGHWLVKNLAAAEYRVVAKAEGYAIGTAMLDLRQGAQEAEALLRLVPAHRHRFEVRNERREPVAAARIYWHASGGRSPAAQFHRGSKFKLSALPILLGKTDAKGELEVSTIEDGASRFLCRHPGYALASSGQQKTSRGVPIRFSLVEGGHVEGTLTQNGGRPEEIHALMAEPRGEIARHYEGVLMPRLTYARPDGSFRFRHLDAGTWKIEVVPKLGHLSSVHEFIKLARQPQRWDRRTNVQVVSGQTVRVVLELERREQQDGIGSIIGSVRLDGRPATGAWVETWTGRHRKTLVDANGNFVLAGLPDGKHWVNVGRPGHEGILSNRIWNGTIEIENGAQATLHIDVRVARVRVLVLDPQGNPLPGLMVALRGKVKPQGQGEGGATAETVTDANGIAMFEAVPEGRYRIRAEGGQESNWVLPVTRIEVWATVNDKLHQVRAIPPVRASGVVEWDLRGLSEEEKETAGKKPRWLSFRSEDRYAWGRIRTDGPRLTFKVDGLAPGAYDVKSWGDLEWSAAKVAVPATGVTGLTLKMKPNRQQLKAILERKKKEAEKGKKKGTRNR